MCRTGSTALVAVIRGTELAVANVGDSRGVLCDMDGKSHPLSFDHKPHEVLPNLYFLIFYLSLLLPLGVRLLEILFQDFFLRFCGHPGRCDLNTV